ncbi:MAG TPA: zf-HC2 domain-containing protein [Pyrinomonadaceae bacterium]|jgi:predicted anti-sigma-YlaC factor YlaD
MDCAESLELLSDYCDGTLADDLRALVQMHLGDCPPCDEIFRDLDSIVRIAVILRGETAELSYPDEEIIWQRLNLSKQIIH